MDKNWLSFFPYSAFYAPLLGVGAPQGGGFPKKYFFSKITPKSVPITKNSYYDILSAIRPYLWSFTENVLFFWERSCATLRIYLQISFLVNQEDCMSEQNIHVWKVRSLFFFLKPIRDALLNEKSTVQIKNGGHQPPFTRGKYSYLWSGQNVHPST